MNWATYRRMDSTCRFDMANKNDFFLVAIVSSSISYFSFLFLDLLCRYGGHSRILYESQLGAFELDTDFPSFIRFFSLP
jgi:hypothetical protein